MKKNEKNMFHKRRKVSRKNKNDIAKKTRKKMKKGTKIFLCVLVIGLIVIASFIGYIYYKLGKLNFEKIDKTDLGINDKGYEDVSDKMSQKEFDKVKTVALFGIDTIDSSIGYYGRSDTIMVASINPKTKAINLISIPRDTYINIPGRGMDKINHAYAYGKEQLAIKTINSNFGLNITEYVTIDFVGLINVINKIGGVNLNITSAEKNYINQTSFESYKISGNKVKKVASTGVVTLSGEQALTHSRNRTIGNDFERAGRQRKVIEAVISKLSSLGVNGIMGISDSLLKEVKTNIKVAEYFGTLSKLAVDKDKYLNNMVSSQIPAAQYSAGKTINKIYYFTTDLTKAKEDFIKKIYGE